MFPIFDYRTGYDSSSIQMTYETNECSNVRMYEALSVFYLFFLMFDVSHELLLLLFAVE